MGQRTSNGTRGLAATTADHLIAGAATTVRAMSRYVTELVANQDIRTVQIVCTGPQTSEDQHCAQYLRALILNEPCDAAVLSDRVREAKVEHQSYWTRQHDEHEISAFFDDIEQCAEVDRHDFAMVGQLVGDDVLLRPTSC